MGWRKFMRLIGGLAIAWPLASYAQEPKQPLKRVGVLAPIPCPLQPDNLAVRRLAELGWIEGQNIVFDCVSRCVQVRICLGMVMAIPPRGAITGAHPMWRSFREQSRRHLRSLPHGHATGPSGQQRGPRSALRLCTGQDSRAP